MKHHPLWPMVRSALFTLTFFGALVLLKSAAVVIGYVIAYWPVFAAGFIGISIAVIIGGWYLDKKSQAQNQSGPGAPGGSER